MDKTTSTGITAFPARHAKTMILLRSFVSPKEPKALAEFYLPAMTSVLATRSPENSAFYTVGVFVGLQNSDLG
ncbi:MAG TPA: hypothetical protein ENJ10_13805 [Caldithrix abyssi]|uniref:Uncharacterized protein n=1 Tax=Caldithrix abyssi TaxID=187145 RepID=A0A7V1PWM8_CALAY|nr:hypothetical protein [Caldithrix abyssi]